MAARPPRRSHTYIPVDEKLRRGIRLNVYDAARGYRDTQGMDPRTSIREIIRREDFRETWRTFRGGARTFSKRGTPTTLDEKVGAASRFGWAPDPAKENTIKYLRGMYGRG